MTAALQGQEAAGPDRSLASSRGDMELQWDGSKDVECLLEWSKGRKWTFTVTAYCISFLVVIPMGGYEQQGKVPSNLFAGSWNLVSLTIGIALLPTILHLTDSFGRRPVFLAAFTIFTSYLFGSAFRHELTFLNDAWSLSAGVCFVIVNIIWRSLDDVWQGTNTTRLATIISFWFNQVAVAALGPFAGPAILEVCRLNSWLFQAIYCIVSVMIYIFVLKETKPIALLTTREAELQKPARRQVDAQSEIDRPSILALIESGANQTFNTLSAQPHNGLLVLWVGYSCGARMALASSTS